MRFSNGSTRVGVQTIVSITQTCSYKKESFLSYQLVEADLLVCMPALGDRIKGGFHEFDKTLHPIPTTSKKSQKMQHFRKNLNPQYHKINELD